MQVLILSNLTAGCKIFDLFMKANDKLNFFLLENQRSLSSKKRFPNVQLNSMTGNKITT